MTTPLEALATAVASHEPYLQTDGELFDPVVGRPTQYGTPYHALCQAALASQGNPADRDRRRHLATLGFKAALAHLDDPTIPYNTSGLVRGTGATTNRNHRDFFWPALLKTYRLLKDLGVSEVDHFAERLAAVDILAAFRSRPPSNWAMVWLSGEWLRHKEGLSPFELSHIDDWLGIFFAGHVLLEQGLYQEPGHPNSYDLFTRYHMADMLRNGYDGAWQADMIRLMETGLERSLAVQLSDGSLASAYRSTGQTWTLGAQCAYFSHAANHFREQGDRDRAEGAAAAAQRAFAAFVRWQRADGPYSPVENCLPPAYRVGYERYSFDGNYSNLAMGFLAMAILNGFAAPAQLDDPDRPPGLRIEGDPTHRAIAHRGPYSLHVNAFPSPSYDGFGLVDLTFGPGRRLHFVSSARHLSDAGFFNLGLAVRREPGLSDLLALAQQDIALAGPIAADGQAGFVLRARVKGSPYLYELAARIEATGVQIRETTPHLNGYKTLLVPYPRDGGWGETTQVTVAGSIVRFTLGREVIRLELEGEIEHLIDFPHGYENRRGLCGLLRIDLAGEREAVAYRMTIER